MRLRMMLYIAVIGIPITVFAQSNGMESVYFGGTSPFVMFMDRLLYVAFAVAVAVAVMIALLKWAAPYIARNLDEAEAIIARAADPEKEVTIGDGIVAAGIILSTTGRLAIIYWAVLTFATSL